MKPVLMGHKKSKLTILVGDGQVEQAQRNGWFKIGADGEKAPDAKLNLKLKKGAKNGEDSR